MRACEHCGNPDKSKWTTDCKFKGGFPSREAFVRSTFDAPCACDDYDEWMAAAARRECRLWVIGFAILIAIVVAIYLVS